MRLKKLSQIRARAKQFKDLRDGLMLQLYPTESARTYLSLTAPQGNTDPTNTAKFILTNFLGSFQRYTGNQQTAYDRGSVSASATSSANVLERQVERAISQVLGRTPGRGVENFINALNDAFPVAADGQVTFTLSRSIVQLYSPSSSTGVVGQLSARQAILYRQASIVAGDALKVLAGLKSFVPEADTVTSDRILATSDLYYIYMHERLGVFRVLAKLQELFRAGTLRISSGEGAYGLYRFDKRNLLRYRMGDRLQAYRRVFGYTKVDPGPSARPNPEFHGLFVHFIAETAKYWRDKRISEVIRERATDPTFGSIAIVRRAGLDLRNNLKNSSYGYVNVLRIETSQALAEAFKVLESADVRAQFGADNAWELIELVLWQYYHQSVHASTMNRMAVTGREILRWLAEPFVLQKNRTDFEAVLYRIAESAEEWISSEEGMRISKPTPPPRNVYQPGPPPTGRRREPVFTTPPKGLRAAPDLTW